MTATSRFERKFLLSPADEAPVLAWLRHAAVPDRRFPAGSIATLYYDTEELSAYHGHRDGDTDKLKVRLRWYRETRPSADGRVQAFLEAKIKRGYETHKLRRELSLPADRLDIPDVTDPLPPGELEQTLAAWGVATGGLFPVAVITYDRRRFRDALTPFAFSYDSRIAAPRLNRRFFPSARPVVLAAHVLEVKGAAGGFPQSLHPLARLGLRWEAFSKYAACLDAAVLTPS